MRQSAAFIKTLKENPKDEQSVNARLLMRAGFVDKVGAGIYSFLPLGFKVLQKIADVIREEMQLIGGQEILLPALHPRENWEKTGRWKELDILYKLRSREGKEMALGPTHEEIIVPLAAKFISSYKDLPVYLFQIQDKFRDELRAKSGLFRGREFLMKDLYSFHADQKGLDEFYEQVKKAYFKIFLRLGLKPLLVEASGGSFSKDFSHEFQIPSEAGEDIIFYCRKCGFSQNKEIFKKGGKCPSCKAEPEKLKSIEVGNIFKLGTKYSEPFGLSFKDKEGKNKFVPVGCYGLGLGRAMGTVAEIHHDENGLVWPESVAPFKYHLLLISPEAKAKSLADKVYKFLSDKGEEILYDDREEASAGEKFADADLIGIPIRLVVSEKTAKEGKVEIKKRGRKDITMVELEEIIKISCSPYSKKN